jgi:hypothetical protein
MRYDEKMEHYGKTELEQLREENQRLREQQHDKVLRLLAKEGPDIIERERRQAKIEVLREVLDEDVHWNPPLQIIVERKLKQLEGE